MGQEAELGGMPSNAAFFLLFFGTLHSDDLNYIPYDYTVELTIDSRY